VRDRGEGKESPERKTVEGKERGKCRFLLRFSFSLSLSPGGFPLWRFSVM